MCTCACMRFLSIYIYISISVRLHHMCVCICVYIYICSCICTHKPGPQIRNGMHQMPVLVCGLHALSVCLSLSRLFPCLCHSVAIASNILVVCHSCVGEVCVQIVDAIYVYVCVLCSCMVVVYFTQLLQGLPRLLYVYRLIYKYIYIYACACPHSFCTANTQTR